MIGAAFLLKGHSKSENSRIVTGAFLGPVADSSAVPAGEPTTLEVPARTQHSEKSTSTKKVSAVLNRTFLILAKAMLPSFFP